MHAEAMETLLAEWVDHRHFEAGQKKDKESKAKQSKAKQSNASALLVGRRSTRRRVSWRESTQASTRRG